MMRYTVLLHCHSSGIYEALAPAVPGCTGTGNTRNEALAHLESALRDRLERTEVTSIDIDFPKTEGKRQNPWLATAGIFADDPQLEHILKEIYSLRKSDRV